VGGSAGSSSCWTSPARWRQLAVAADESWIRDAGAPGTADASEARQIFHGEAGQDVGEEELLRDAEVVHPHRAKLLALLGSCHLSLSRSMELG
jgi:hypothetical protein